jgi:hypothetical protein
MVFMQGSLEHALNYGNQLMAEFCNTQAMELLPQVLSCFGSVVRVHEILVRIHTSD